METLEKSPEPKKAKVDPNRLAEIKGLSPLEKHLPAASDEEKRAFLLREDVQFILHNVKIPDGEGFEDFQRARDWFWIKEIWANLNHLEWAPLILTQYDETKGSMEYIDLDGQHRLLALHYGYKQLINPAWKIPFGYELEALEEKKNA